MSRSEFRLPLALRALNAVGAAVGERWPALDAEQMWQSAVRASGSSAPFPEAREALEVLVGEARGAPLSTLGRIALTRELPSALEQLLRIRDAEVVDEPILPQVFVASLPRTGTTLLHRLLSLHQAARWPRMWELVRPWPSPEPDRTDDPRIGQAEAMARDARRVMPALDQIHELDPHGPDECYYLLNHTACCAAWDAQLPVPGYTRWFLAQDLRWTYAHHRRCLQVLQRHLRGAFWLLKTPLHLFGLDALRHTYPDARLIVTHRAPERVAASCCSLYESARAIHVREVDPGAIGPAWLDVWGTATDRATEALRSWPADRVAHVLYEDLVDRPAEAVPRLIAALGLPEDPELPARIERWTADRRSNPAARHGVHRYELSRYGLRPEAVRERFAGWHT